MKMIKRVYKLFPNSKWFEYIKYEHGSQNFDYENTNLRLENINIFEIVLNEDLIKAGPKISKMISYNKPEGYINTNDPDRVNERLNKILISSLVKSWSKLGFINFKNNKVMNKYVNYVELNIITISGSFSILSVNINLNDVINTEIKKTILNNIEPLSYRGNFTRYEILKHRKLMNFGQISKAETKHHIIEDMITEIKFQCLQEVNKWIKIYFTNNGICSPSFNAYSTNIKSNDKLRKSAHLWQAIGVENFFGDLRKNEDWALFLNNEDMDSNMKFNNYAVIFCDNYSDDISSNTKNAINFAIENISFQYFFIPVYKTFMQYYENQFTKNRRNFYSLISDSKLSLSNWIKIKMRSDQTEYMFRRVKETIKDEYYLSLINEEKNNFISFNSKFRKGIYHEEYWKYLISLYDQIENSQVILSNNLNGYLNSITSRNNYKYNRNSIILMLVTALISTISVLISLYSVLIATGKI